MNRTRFQLAAALGGLSLGLLSLHAKPSAILARVAQYEQKSTATPALSASLPYLFIANGENFDAGAIDVMSVTLPTTGVFDVTAKNDGGTTENFEFQGRYQSLTAFNSTFPAGTYKITFVPSDAASVTLTMSVKSTSFPTAPKVSNFTAAQTIDATKSFVLSWGAFTGATANDRILFGIQGATDDDYDFIETGTPAGPTGTATGSIAATAKSFTIPAATLPPGTDFTAQIIFVHADVQSSVSQGYYASGSAAITQVKLHTAGALDTKAPTVASSTPANNATGVASTQTVTIVFSESMRSHWGWSVSFNNIGNASPVVSWKDLKTLTIAPPAGGWPKGKKIGVILNPAGWDASIRDLAGNALASKTISFTTKS